MSLKLRRFINRLKPSFGFIRCFRCLDSRSHDGEGVMYTPSVGITPICKRCERETTPPERVKFYRALWEHWYEKGVVPQDGWKEAGFSSKDEEWRAIERAVLSDKSRRST